MLLSESRSGRSRLWLRLLQFRANSPILGLLRRQKVSWVDPLAVMPLTVWNPPAKSVRSPSRRAEELKRKDSESKIGGDGGSLLLNAELAASAVSSILKDYDLERSKALPVDEALALSLQGVASVSSYVLSCLFPF